MSAILQSGMTDVRPVDVIDSRRGGPEPHTRRLDREMLADVAWAPAERPRIYVCGPTSFVEAAADALVALGHDPDLVRTERFGPTGG